MQRMDSAPDSHFRDHESVDIKNETGRRMTEALRRKKEKKKKKGSRMIGHLLKKHEQGGVRVYAGTTTQPPESDKWQDSRRWALGRRKVGMVAQEGRRKGKKWGRKTTSS
ncbi:hypothetical protein Bpfe_001460 [Biomphalaria pfeifferi]|uniref:Uncharacterized protein n=1 Tax=Biomphalaria pfeifferi TaxID=112525 RepID=A0AAD8CBF3_BIOPF|nr:hypothetical protein Bpfe_001460 [Biomphalaria pfeifferi]